ncbi:MAG: hypothetical protein ACI9BK_001473 [Acidimicrobiales bacterium]|jgi:hypothetical protein
MWDPFDPVANAKPSARGQNVAQCSGDEPYAGQVIWRRD